MNSSNPSIHALPSEYQSWTRLFHIFLTRSENGKAKPLRRLLLTLTNLIVNHPADDARLALIGHALWVATRAIRRQDQVASIKAAIQVLEHFLSKDLVSSLDIVQFTSPQDLEQHRSISRLGKHVAHDFNHNVREFTFSVLDWVQYPDCAPAIGRFLPALFSSLRQIQEGDTSHGFPNGTLPLWMSPVKQSLIKHQNLLEVYENHILPGLIRLSPVDRKAFLTTLPLNDIQNGNVGKYALADIQLCLLIARIGSLSEPSLDSTCSQDYSGKVNDDHDTKRGHNGPSLLADGSNLIAVDATRLGINLLEHSLPAVRTSALSLLISSPVSAQYFIKEVLQNLQRCLPCFHIEVNTKARNEFIAFMRKLCENLRRAIMCLIRETRDSVKTNHAERHADVMAGPQGQHDPTEMLEMHLAFRSWYARFLRHELQPSSSYQSHITALKVLHPLLEEEHPVQTSVSKDQGQYAKMLNEISQRDLLLRPLLDILLDPFDDVRHAAGSLLQLLVASRKPLISANGHHRIKSETEIYEKDAVVHNAHVEVLEALENAESKAAKTGRADHADGVGRLYHILYGSSKSPDTSHVWYDNASLILDCLVSKVEREVEIASRDLPMAVSVAALHGHLIALR